MPLTKNPRFETFETKEQRDLEARKRLKSLSPKRPFSICLCEKNGDSSYHLTDEIYPNTHHAKEFLNQTSELEHKTF